MIRKTLVGLLSLLVGGMVGWSDSAAAQEYQVDLGRQNRVSFLSDAPLEAFRGVTDRMDGFVFLEGEGLAGATNLAASEFYFEVDLASLDTGIGLRNRHMRENYLETDRFPFASFSGRIQRLVPEPGGGHLATAAGTLSIHGVEQPREILCRVTALDPEGGGREGGGTSAGPAPLRVLCAFEVTLSDHRIPIPTMMFMKIDEVMELELDFHLVPAGTVERLPADQAPIPSETTP